MKLGELKESLCGFELCQVTDFSQHLKVIFDGYCYDIPDEYAAYEVIGHGVRCISGEFEIAVRSEGGKSNDCKAE